MRRWLSYQIEVLRDARATRLLHYELMLGVGLALGRHQLGGQPAVDNRTLVFTALAIACAWIFSVITNNIADVTIDAISNPDRPHVRNAIPPVAYKRSAASYGIGAILAAAAASAWVLVATGLFVAAYWIYSMPPLRFKRVTAVSKLVISGNSLLLLLLGYRLYAQTWHGFRWGLVPVFLLAFTWAANFIDLKDVDGDRAAGLRTLPTLLGLERAQRWIAAGFALTYLAIAAVFPRWPVFAAIALGSCAQVVLLTRKPYRERWVLWCHDLNLLIAIAYLWFSTP